MKEFRPFPGRTIDTIVYHCSDTESGDVKGIRNYHVTVKGWKDIGYHYVITRTGELQLGRPITSTGAHVEGANTTTIGICLIGKTKFNEVQFETMRHIDSELKRSITSIKFSKPHNSYPTAKKQGKTCPNFDVDAVLNKTVKGD